MLDPPPLKSSRVLLERYLVNLAPLADDPEAAAVAEAIRAELAARPWQGPNPYA
jgi:hypothetical protein